MWLINCGLRHKQRWWHIFAWFKKPLVYSVSHTCFYFYFFIYNLFLSFLCVITFIFSQSFLSYFAQLTLILFVIRFSLQFYVSIFLFRPISNRIIFFLVSIASWRAALGSFISLWLFVSGALSLGAKKVEDWNCKFEIYLHLIWFVFS